MIKPSRVEILGVPVDCVDMRTALRHVRAGLNSGKTITVLAVNPEKVMTARRDVQTMSSLRKSGLLIPDGIGVVWAAKWLYDENLERVPGAELMPEICALSAEEGYKVFLFGGAPGVVEEAAAILKRKYPNLRIVGVQHGFLDELEMPKLIDRINESSAHIMFVALGSPRQEQWIERYSPRLDIRIFQGVGGTFDVIAGRVSRAPEAFRKARLEWFYRLIVDPRRVKRQVVYPLFVIMVWWQKMRLTLLRKP